MSKKFLSITLFFTTLALIFEGGVSGVFGLVQVFVNLFFFGLFLALFRALFLRSWSNLRPYMIRSILLIGGLYGAVAGVLFLFIGYSTLFPTPLSIVKLSDGQKSMIYVQMSHIATPRYYDSISEKLRAYSSSGYVLYREGVGPGTPENQQYFDSLLGMKLHSGTYDDIASWMGLEAQSDRIYSQIDAGDILSHDLSLDDIVAITGTASLSSLPPVDIGAELGILRDRPTGPLFYALVRSIMDFSLRMIGSGDMLFERFSPDLQRAILDERERSLVEGISRDGHEHIVVVYGALHFDGVYRLLKEKNPLWNIISLEPIYPYKP